MGYIYNIYMSYCIRLIVLYSRCRVNRGTNLSVVLYYVILILASTVRVWAPVLGIPNLWGVPHYAAVHSVTFGFGAQGLSFLPNPP